MCLFLQKEKQNDSIIYAKESLPVGWGEDVWVAGGFYMRNSLGHLQIKVDLDCSKLVLQ